MKTVIFDFNRTLYDPDTRGLVEGALLVLQFLSSRAVCLCLVSRREAGRESELGRLGIEHFFQEVVFAESKDSQVFEGIILRVKADRAKTYVVGDYLYDEIRIGNQLGLKTIWFRQGAFANLKPETPQDVPWRAIEKLSALTKLI